MGSSLRDKTRRVHRWLRQDIDLFVLVVLTVIVLSTWLVAELADEVSEGTTQRYDEWVWPAHPRRHDRPYRPEVV